jgi:flagellar basal-body rod protein FlgF
MLKGLYDASAGMKARLALQDVIASNLANAGSSGFQRQVVALHGRMLDMAVSTLQARRFTPTGEPGWIPLPTLREVLEPFSKPDTRPGVLQHTGAATDLALDGPGYLVVQTAGGQRLIRSGSFRSNGDGNLATSAGDPLLTIEGKPIPVAGKAWSVAPDGAVSADGAVLGRLRLVLPTGPVRAEGASLASTEGVQDLPASAVQVRQGFLEHSNVQPVQEMVDMIAGVRAYEASQRAVLTQDQSLQDLLGVLQHP